MTQTSRESNKADSLFTYPVGKNSFKKAKKKKVAWEGSKADKEMDKKQGAKEGSKKDNAIDKRMETKMKKKKTGYKMLEGAMKKISKKC